jgi:hypothetical protein
MIKRWQWYLLFIAESHSTLNRHLSVTPLLAHREQTHTKTLSGDPQQTVGLQVLTPVVMKISILTYITPYSPLKLNEWKKRAGKRPELK